MAKKKPAKKEKLDYKPMSLAELQEFGRRTDIVLVSAKYKDDGSTMYGLGKELCKYKMVSEGGEWCVLRGPYKIGSYAVIPIARPRDDNRPDDGL